MPGKTAPTAMISPEGKRDEGNKHQEIQQPWDYFPSATPGLPFRALVQSRTARW